MNEVSQGFFKGISQATQRSESFDPEVFYSLKNARVLQEGNLGEVTRINGYTNTGSTIQELDVLYDIINVGDLFFVFYKGDEAISGGEYTFYVRVYNSEATQQTFFTYTDSVLPEKGELKQYDDTVFIAPHNKVIFEKEGTYYLKDFISSPTKITEIDTQDIEDSAASVTITFGNTLSGYGGKPAKGYIRVNSNNVPAGVSDTVQVSIAGTLSNDIELDGTMSREEIAQALTDEINNSIAGWDAELIASRLVEVTSTTSDSTDNGAVITIVGREYISSEDISLFELDPNVTGDEQNRLRVSGSSTLNIAGFATTIATVNASGGIDSSTISGSVNIILKGGIVTRPISIDSTDTTTDIATKIETILNEDSFVTERYTVSRTTNAVTLTAKKKGSLYTTDFVLSINSEGSNVIELPDDFYSTSITQGTDEQPTGTLKAYTNYWYKARLKYIDGHLTPSCSPAFANSEDNRYVEVTFDVDVSDLDNNFPRLQIFRKEEGEEFFLIKEIDLDNETVVGGEFVFVDEGFSKKELFTEQNLVWTKKHKTQEVIENRLVKANVEFFDEDYDISDADFTLSVITDNDNNDVAPIKSKLELYARPQYTDGTLGFFTELGRVDIDAKNKRIGVQQNNVITGQEKDINEFRFYGKYLPYSEETTFSFRTPEIQTPNLEAIEEPDLFPVNSKVFYGYKYIIVNSVLADAGKQAYVSVSGWNGDETERYLRWIGKVETGTDFTNRVRLLSSGKLEVNVHGRVRTYIPIAIKDEGSATDESIVYKLEDFEALKDAVSTRELFLKVSNRGTPLSSEVSNDDLANLSVKITGIDDKSDISGFEVRKDRVYIPGFTFDSSVRKSYISPSLDSRIYLNLEESLLDEIDNTEVNRYGLNGYRREALFNRLGILEFSLINFEKESEPVFDFDNNRVVFDQEEYYKLNITEATYLLINKDLSTEDGVIYLGKKDNTVDGSAVELYTTGFRKNTKDHLIYSVLNTYNIYDTLLSESDFNFSRTDFANQLIWSNPLLSSNYFAGGRNYNVSNFFNIPTENGEIIDLVSYNGRLYVFCERGVAQVLIGETLTQQKNGQVFVDSSRFITKVLWLLENTPNIKEKSIIKQEGNIFFCDGNDVYTISGQGIQNLTQGKVPLDEGVDYISTYVKKYDEYRLSNPTTTETFVYNTKYKQWYGPFTYVPEDTVEVDGNIYSWIDTHIMLEDSGNLFNGTAFDTEIQSVANDTQIGTMDKTYRKFYLDVSGTEDVDGNVTDTTFKYGKDFSDMETIALDASSGITKKNNWYHVGIKPEEGNTKKIFWDIVTTNTNFSLRGLITAFMVRRRR